MTGRVWMRLLVGGLLGLAPLRVCAAGPGRAPTVDYNRDVRPILSDHCYTCHGPDASRRKAGLRLDRREDALHESEPGVAAVVPGSRSRSLLFQRIKAELKQPVIFDGRNLYDPELMKALDIRYYSVGRPVV